MSDRFATLLIFALIGSACFVVAAAPHLTAFSTLVSLGGQIYYLNINAASVRLQACFASMIERRIARVRGEAAPAACRPRPSGWRAAARSDPR